MVDSGIPLPQAGVVAERSEAREGLTFSKLALSVMARAAHDTSPASGRGTWFA